MEKSAAKLAEDSCYLEDIDEFKSFKLSSTENALPAYELVLPIVEHFYE